MPDGNIIALLREKEGLTQVQLAEKTGINIRLIQKHESQECSTSNMTLKNALALVAALNCSVGDLIQKEEL